MATTVVDNGDQVVADIIDIVGAPRVANTVSSRTLILQFELALMGLSGVRLHDGS